jgi:hypothetical protein
MRCQNGGEHQKIVEALMPHMGYNSVVLLAQQVCFFEYVFESFLFQKCPERLRVVVE